MKLDTRAMRPGTQTLIRLILLALWLELSLLGATFNGILLPDFQPLTLAMIGVGLVIWLAWHARAQRPWHSTALDGVIVGWWLVFALSIAANGETWRRSAEALWYMGLYTLVFFVLSDLIAQGMPRSTLSFIVLIAGGLHVFIGALQTVTLLQTGGFDALRRPVGLIGNPNAYGALLLALLPLALSEVLTARRNLTRGLWLVYAGAIAALLFFSASRGAWAGAAIGLFIYGVLALRHYGLTSWTAIQGAWGRLSRGIQGFAVILALVACLGVGIAGLFFVRSLSDQTRSADLRTYLWVAAGNAFQEKPLTGWGLFTYGRQLDRFSSIPPMQPHSHAHNVIFTMAAELGVPGLLILLASVGVTFTQMRRVWHALNRDRERVIWMGQAAALIGLGIHHLLDTPAMMPVIALIVIILLAGSLALPQPPLQSARFQPIFSAISMINVTVLLLVGGWAVQLHTVYQAALEMGLDDPRAGAQALNTVIAQDPRQSSALLEQAYLYGLAADEDDRLVPQAIDAFLAYLAVEPTHSEAWVNLSALYWQANNQEQAQLAIQEALRLAPDAPFAILEQVYARRTVDQSAVPIFVSPYAVNRARNEYLSNVIEPEYLPQVLDLVGQ